MTSRDSEECGVLWLTVEARYLLSFFAPKSSRAPAQVNSCIGSCLALHYIDTYIT
jgi:hypothetical protein